MEKKRFGDQKGISLSELSSMVDKNSDGYKLALADATAFEDSLPADQKGRLSIEDSALLLYAKRNNIRLNSVL